MPPRRFVFDTNIYRYSATSPEFETQLQEDFHSIRISSVVLSELWRSAQTKPAQASLRALERKPSDFIFAPLHQDWREVGQYLATRLSKAGRKPTAETFHALRKEQNDALIAFSTWNRGFTVVTCDHDFERLREWAKAPSWKLVLRQAPEASP